MTGGNFFLQDAFRDGKICPSAATWQTVRNTFGPLRKTDAIHRTWHITHHCRQASKTGNIYRKFGEICTSGF